MCTASRCSILSQSQLDLSIDLICDSVREDKERESQRSHSCLWLVRSSIWRIIFHLQGNLRTSSWSFLMLRSLLLVPSTSRDQKARVFSALSCFDIFSSMGVESVQALSFRISRRKSSSWNASFHCVSESKPGRRDIMMIMPWSVWFFKRSNERLLPYLLHDSRHRDECWLHFSILCRESSLTRLSSCAKYFVLESMSMGVFFLVMYRKSCENAGVFRKLRWQFVRTGATLYVKHQLQRRLPLLRRQRLRGCQICQLLICWHICNENWQVRIVSIK